MAVVAAANAVSLAQLVRVLLSGGQISGRHVILAAVAVWLTNIVVFALAYWEIDRSGPHARSTDRDAVPELLFP